MEPATIKNLETGQIIDCMFRPKEYTASKQNTWNQGRSAGRDMTQPRFSGGNPITLQMELLFDTYEEHRQGARVLNKAGDDVRKFTNPIWQLMLTKSSNRRNPRTGKGQPPKVEFRWGTTWSFKAVITNISQKFTFFLPNGTPVRSTVNVTFQQLEQEDEFPFQNPTSGGQAGYRRRVVREGETIDAIAFQEYGHPTHWRHLARANNLDDPLRLRPGQVLTVAPLD
ncbi:MAG TPA: LysM peptidoglycan-binding domain-containing protein [Dehalococcoidia bacterium]|nr:LysM peptidoglycan-binding domain-containing protein [Dehalococcoidia bacterium]